MAFKEANEQMADTIKWVDDPAVPGVFIGTTVEGYYVQKKENIGANNSTVYVLQMEDGALASFWGSALIDGKMKEIPFNVRIRVSYLGEKKSQKTSRTYRDFRIEYDPDDVVKKTSSMKTAGESSDEPF